MQFQPRASWGAAAPLGPLTPWPVGQPTGYTHHWEGAGGQADHSQCAAEVRSIQAYHQTHGYWDIAYNWIVCLHGVIFEGRQVGQFESAAQKDGNPTHIAVCFMWGPQWSITNGAKSAAVQIVLSKPEPALLGHRDEPSCSTSCPGDNVEAFVHNELPILVHSRIVPQPGPAPAPNPLPPAGIHHPTLAQGSVGPAVLELQRKLNGVAGAHLAVDGKFGPLTKQAVENFQRFFKLQVDGIAGPQTWGMLDYCAAIKGVH